MTTPAGGRPPPSSRGGLARVDFCGRIGRCELFPAKSAFCLGSAGKDLAIRLGPGTASLRAPLGARGPHRGHEAASRRPCGRPWSLRPSGARGLRRGARSPDPLSRVLAPVRHARGGPLSGPWSPAPPASRLCFRGALGERRGARRPVPGRGSRRPGGGWAVRGGRAGGLRVAYGRRGGSWGRALPARPERVEARVGSRHNSAHGSQHDSSARWRIRTGAPRDSAGPGAFGFCRQALPATDHTARDPPALPCTMDTARPG